MRIIADTAPGAPVPYGQRSAGLLPYLGDSSIIVDPATNAMLVLNAQGTESLRQTLYITSTADPGPTDVYVVAIGVSTYKNSAYNLRYAAKDAFFKEVLDSQRNFAKTVVPYWTKIIDLYSELGNSALKK